MPKPTRAKTKASRIPLDYHRQADPTERTKSRATLLVFLVALAIVVGFLVMPVESQRWHSPGPVAEPHAIWDQKCEACHVDFEPRRADAVSLFGAKNPGDAKSEVGWNTASDRKCMGCHQVAAHASSESKVGTSEDSCATCHLDHRGQTASLTLVDSRHCARCHREPAHNNATEMQKRRFEIMSFSEEGHPKFSSVKSDPGSIEFLHNVHMAEGLPAYDKETGQLTKKKLKKFEDLTPEWQEKYAKPNQGEFVQLDCADCHQPTLNGRDMQPIVYEHHCQACHPLNLVVNHTDELITIDAIPHGESLTKIRQWLDQRFAQRILDSKADEWLIPATKKPEPVPGEPSAEDIRALSDLRGQKVSVGLEYLEKAVCSECHEIVGGDVEVVGREPIPSTWFKHSDFSHRAHRAVRCQECHEAADSSHTQSHVMIPNLDNCIKCHAPASSSGGGARHDCVECHRYHGSGTHDLSPGLYPDQPMAIDALREGKTFVE